MRTETDRPTDRHDEASICFLKLCERARKDKNQILVITFTCNTSYSVGNSMSHSSTQSTGKPRHFSCVSLQFIPKNREEF
jgi:hypothetical protein